MYLPDVDYFSSVMKAWDSVSDDGARQLYDDLWAAVALSHALGQLPVWFDLSESRSTLLLIELTGFIKTGHLDSALGVIVDTRYQNESSSLYLVLKGHFQTMRHKYIDGVYHLDD